MVPLEQGYSVPSMVHIVSTNCDDLGVIRQIQQGIRADQKHTDFLSTF